MILLIVTITSTKLRNEDVNAPYISIIPINAIKDAQWGTMMSVVEPLAVSPNIRVNDSCGVNMTRTREKVTSPVSSMNHLNLDTKNCIAVGFTKGSDVWPRKGEKYVPLKVLNFICCTKHRNAGGSPDRNYKSLREMTAPFQTLPIVMYSDSDKDRDIIMAYQRGANLFVNKPFSIKEIIITIERILTTDWSDLNRATEEHLRLYKKNKP
jgi:hypothetical protein